MKMHEEYASACVYCALRAGSTFPVLVATSCVNEAMQSRHVSVPTHRAATRKPHLMFQQFAYMYAVLYYQLVYTYTPV